MMHDGLRIGLALPMLFLCRAGAAGDAKTSGFYNRLARYDNTSWGAVYGLAYTVPRKTLRLIRGATKWSSAAHTGVRIRA
jgi:hypothetical protein